MNEPALKTVVIIPALNEEASIGSVLTDIPKAYRQNVIVADNGSTDRTVEVARSFGAKIANSSRKGYGSACLAGMAIAQSFDPDVVIFVDGDYSDFPEDMTNLIEAMITKNLDFVVGSRTLGLAEKGALLPQAQFGNWLATFLIKIIFGYRYTDLGPFRAIKKTALDQLRMQDPNFGWTVEMQIKALQHGLRIGEVPVRYRKRIGKSKITGTVKGTILAGYKILWTIARFGFSK